MKIPEFISNHWLDDIEFLIERILKKGGTLPINESISSDKYEKFVKNKGLDPNNLIIGQDYYPVRITSMPDSIALNIRLANDPCKLLSTSKVLTFELNNKTFDLQLSQTVYNGVYLTPLFFKTEKDRNQFITSMQLTLGPDYDPFNYLTW